MPHRSGNGTPCWTAGSGWLDILLVNEGRKIICAIENKIFSPESGRQLTFYRKALERDYCGFTRHYVFLSPTGMAPVHSDDRAFWTPVSLQRRSGTGGRDGGRPRPAPLVRIFAGF